MARGQKPLGWLFDYLAGNPQGEPYEVLPLVQPTIDVARTWPWHPRVINLDGTSASGGTENISIDPGEGRAFKIWQMWATLDNTGAAKHFLLFWESEGSAGARRVTLVRVEGTRLATPGAPIIGGAHVTGAAGTSPPQQIGIPPIIVAFPNSLIFSIAALDAADQWTLRLLVDDVPFRTPLLF